MKNKFLLILFYFSFIAFNGFSQSSAIDSLEILLKRNTESRNKFHITNYDKRDTLRVKILIAFSSELLNKRRDDESNKYSLEAEKISKKIGYLLGEAEANNLLGNYYFCQNNFEEAIKRFKAFVIIIEKLGYNLRAAHSYNNLGTLSDREGNHPEALNYFFKALRIAEKLKDKYLMASVYNNIGITYDEIGKLHEALKNYLQALKLFKEVGEKKSISITCLNIGTNYKYQSKFPEALNYFFDALKLKEEIGDKKGAASIYTNIGVVYFDLNNDTASLRYQLLALKLKRELKNIPGMATALCNLGDIYTRIGRYKEAKQHYKEAISISKELGLKLVIKSTYEGLNKLDSITGDWEDAYKHQQLLIIYRDSLNNKENSEKILKTQLEYEFDKKELALQKEAAIKAIQFEYQKKQSLAKSEKEKQQLMYEQQIKEQHIKFEYNQKIIASEAEKRQQTALNKVLSEENQLMAENSKNETIIRWLMLAALLGFTAFGINYYRSYKRQKSDNLQIVKQAEDLKTLMKEVHHRVKNNLQLIVAMLRMQHRTIEDKAAIEALVNSENRLHAIAMVHEKLYKTENITSVLLKDYLQELIDVLDNQFNNAFKQIQFTIIDNTNYTTNLDTAISIGLIVNELVTNSLKYAFTDLEKGEIHLEISRIDNKYQLSIQDNGKGLPNDQLLKNPKTLGLRLVNLFTDQLNGFLQYSSNKGACFTILF